jgi:hypothetical protein
MSAEGRSRISKLLEFIKLDIEDSEKLLAAEYLDLDKLHRELRNIQQRSQLALEILWDMK